MMNKAHPKYDENFLALRPEPTAGDGQYEYFTCKDGTKLFVQYWLPDKGPVERVLLCMHGMSAHGWYYSLTADALVPHGVAVYVPDYRSHGLSDGHPGHLSDGIILVEDIAELSEHIMARHPGARLFVLGESLGGAVNVNFNIDHPGKAAGMILLAPAIKPAMKFSLRDFIKIPFYLLAFLISRSWRVVKVTGDEHRGMRNKDNIVYDQNDPLHLKYVSTAYMMAVKKLLDRAAKIGAASIKTPALIFQGGMDVAVSAAATKQFFENLASEDKTFKFYPEAFHCMQTDSGCADMRDIIRDWLLAR